jgi:hypothetical protein
MAAFGLGAPLVIGAGLKIAYDLLLFAAYRRVPDEGQRDRLTEGQRDRLTEGQKDGGTEGR